MPSPQDVLDAYAEGVPYTDLTKDFLERRRWGGDPVCLLAEAAAATTGQRYATGIYPTVRRFREAFIETGRLQRFAELAALDLEDDDLIESFGAQRKRQVLIEAAGELADRVDSVGERDDRTDRRSDLESLQDWAFEADPFHYDTDPIGAIDGVGPGSFQYLRMLAGVDTVKPDPEVTQLLAAVADDASVPALYVDDPIEAVAACEWLAVVTSYRRIEIDRIAWWTFTDDEQREAVLSLHEG